MSGGSQHNPNGRQSQLGPGWSPLQVANFLARAPQVHLPTDRGVTWHTPTPPPHLYHVPAPSPPDPLQVPLYVLNRHTPMPSSPKALQAMKSVGSNSVFRHSATPPELFRHTPTPPDKHLMRHTPSPGDVKAGGALAQPELYPHLGPASRTIDDYINNRDKLVRPEELLAYARVGVDLSLSGRANGSPSSPALSVRDAPTINSLIARAARPPHARVDALLERLAPAPASPLSVIVHPRAAPTPSPPSSNEDSADSCGAPPGSKRKRKPERTIRVPSAPPLAPSPSLTITPTPTTAAPAPAPCPSPTIEATPSKTPEPTPPPAPTPEETEETPHNPPSPKPIENGDMPHTKSNGPEKPPTPPPPTRRKTRSGSAETIDDIAAMIASTDRADPVVPEPPTPVEPVTVDNLKSVLASPEQVKPDSERMEEVLPPQEPAVEAAAPRRRSARTSNSETANVPIESPSEAKPAEPETSEPTVEPTAASFVEVENQLEKMFAGIEEEETEGVKPEQQTPKAKKRRKSAPTKGDRKAARRASRASTVEEGPRRKANRKKETKPKKRETSVKDAYDSGSNASSGRSRGPYIQIRGPRDSPLSVSVINASTGEEEETTGIRRKGEEFRNGLRARGLHASTLGLRYDATTPDASWRCVFCDRGPHAAGLGDLFGPYNVDTDCEEYRALEESRRRAFPAGEVWLHAACGVWAPGVVAAGARVWGLRAAVWAARAGLCLHCRRPPAPLACAARACAARAHLPCAQAALWDLPGDTFRPLCPAHKP